MKQREKLLGPKPFFILGPSFRAGAGAQQTPNQVSQHHFEKRRDVISVRSVM